MSTTTPTGYQPTISPPEVDLLAALSAHTTAEWRQQVKVKTKFATFFLDLACAAESGRQIGVECDGWEFHKDKLRDLCRDALILATGEVACIYRLGAWAVNRQNLRIDWLWVLSRKEPHLFDESSRATINSLFIACVERDGITRGRFDGFLSILTLQSEGVKELVDFADAHVGMTFPQLVEAARAAGVRA